jgi:hypothetical protein
MSTCVAKLPCLDCNSSDSLQVYLNVDKDLGIEWYTSFCHSECWEMKGDPYVGKTPPKVHVKSDAEIKEELETIRNCRVFSPKNPFRGIPPSFYKSWGVRLMLSEFDGRTPYALGFPLYIYEELVGWKCRPLKKKDFFGLGRSAGIDPFGLPRALNINTNTLFFTEGEFDAIALDYCMSLVGNAERYPVISLSHGGGSIQTNIERILDRVTHIKYFVLVLDDDKIGREAEAKALSLWPDRVILVKKPSKCKDANDAVLAGLAREMGNLALNFLKQ